jgi:hypothetical protein
MLKILSDIIENVKNKDAKKALKNLERMAQKKAALEAKIKSLQTGTPVKAAALPKTQQVQTPKVELKQASSSVKNKLFISTTNKSIKSFYVNYKEVFTLIEIDRQSLKSPQYAPNQNDSLRVRAAVSINAQIANSLAQLNFFKLYKELRAQEQLAAKFPGSFLTDKKQKQIFDLFKTEMKKLQAEVYAVYQRKHITDSFSQKINAIESESKVFADVSQLLK